jgi:hypothetical protein
MNVRYTIPAFVIACALGLAALPAQAQTAPAPTGAGADLVGGADHPYGDGGVTPDQAAQLGDILGSDGGIDSVIDELQPMNGVPGFGGPPADSDDGIDSVIDELQPMNGVPGFGGPVAGNDAGEGGVEPLPRNADGVPQVDLPLGDPADLGPDAAEGDGGNDGDADDGMSADEYADHLDDNADEWDDLADGASDPADAARWRKHAKDLRAEAARARAQAARDQAQQQAQLMAVDNAVSVAVNSVGQHIRPQTGMHAAGHAARAGSHAAARAATPHVETPRLVITVGPSMMHY